MKQVIPGGGYCDALPTGEYVALVLNQYMATHLGRIDFADMKRQPLFVRCTNVGGFSFAGQSWNTPELLLWAAQWSFGPAVGGISPVIFRADGSLQTKPFVYPDGSVCSQGWRFEDKAGRLWNGDETYGPTARAPKLFEWTDISDGDTLVVGQGADTGGVVVWDGTAHRQLALGACRFIRAHRSGEKVSIAFYRELGSGSESEIHWVTVAELRALPVVVVPPPPPPPRPDNFGQRSGRIPNGTTIDLRQFVFGAASTFPRTGAHGMHQADLGGGQYALVKFQQARAYELWSLGENYIHHLEDASDGRLPKDVKPGEKQPQTYHFTDTRWMPFTWKVGDSFKVPAHEAVFFYRDTGVEFDRWPYARRMQIVEAWEKFDCGPDLGVRRAICVLYDPTDGWHGPDRFVELFWFAEGAGWIGWHPHRSDLVFAGGGQKFDITTQSEALKGFYLFGSAAVVPALTGLAHAPTEVPPVSVPDYSADVRALFATDAFNLTTKDGCGIFTDACARMLKAKDVRFGHLIKKPGQNQYDGHAVDAVLYLSDTPGQSVAVDLISASETPEAKPSWGLDIPRYSASDWRDPGPQPASKVQRPALPFMLGMTAFDWGTHRDQAWLDLQTQYKLPVLRLVPQSVFRTPRTLAEGLAQTDTALATLKAQGRKALVVINCDTKEYGMTRDDVRANTSAMSAILTKHLPAVFAATLSNENQNGNEQPFMGDPFFLLELDGLVDARVPLAWGTMFGRDVAPAITGGSWIAHHADRGLSPEENGKIMAAAQAKYGKPVVDQEPLGLAEPGTPGQRTYDPEYGRALGAAAKKYKLGGLIYHTQAGLRASALQFGNVHKAGAVALVEGLGQQPGPPPPPPPAGDPILDADMTIDSIWYPIFVTRHLALQNAIIQEYTRVKGTAPHDELIRHYLYRACAERSRWLTMRRAIGDVG